jgi:hypothetical protein
MTFDALFSLLAGQPCRGLEAELRPLASEADYIQRGRAAAPVGTIVCTPAGIGIVRASRVEYDDGARIRVLTLGPPARNSERDPIKRHIAREWRERTEYLVACAADDTRDDAQREAQRAARGRVEFLLRAAGL